MKGFREFILRGNVIDLAVAVVIGAAFTALVTAVVTNIFNPLIGAIFNAKSLDTALIAHIHLTAGTADIKFGAVMIAGLVAAVAGILAVWQTEFISPSVAQFSRSALAVVMVILGGTGTLLGPLVGAAIVIGAEYWLSTYVERWATVLGVVFIVVVLFARRGIVGELEALLHRRWGSGPPTDGRAPVPVAMDAADRSALDRIDPGDER